MKVLSRRYSVSPPNTTMMARLAHSIGWTFFRRTSSQPTCMMVAPIATAVATKMSQIWMATKKSATGKRSYRNFIQGAHSTRLWYGSRRLRRGGAVPVRHDVDAVRHLSAAARAERRHRARMGAVDPGRRPARLRGDGCRHRLLGRPRAPGARALWRLDPCRQRGVRGCIPGAALRRCKLEPAARCDCAMGDHVLGATLAAVGAAGALCRHAEHPVALDAR